MVQIASNAGAEGLTVVFRVRQQKDPRVGYDARTAQYCNLAARGIIDPAGVVCTALENAVSASAAVITTERIVAELPPPERKQQAKVPTGHDLPPCCSGVPRTLKTTGEQDEGTDDL